MTDQIDPRQAQIIQDWIDIFTADPRELITHRRVACRHCHGIDHKFQWKDQAEFMDAVRRHMDETYELDKKGKAQHREMPNFEGGFGFRPNAPVHPGCPDCYGEGVSDIFMPDFSSLSPKALKLLAGVKVTKGGIEIQMHDQMRARDNLAKHLGMLIDRVREETSKEPPPAVQLTPEQLNEALKILKDKY